MTYPCFTNKPQRIYRIKDTLTSPQRQAAIWTISTFAGLCLYINLQGHAPGLIDHVPGLAELVSRVCPRYASVGHALLMNALPALMFSFYITDRIRGCGVDTEYLPAQTGWFGGEIHGAVKEKLSGPSIELPRAQALQAVKEADHI